MKLTQKEVDELAEKHMPALDVLLADGMPGLAAAEFVVACALKDMDTLAAAEHTVSLRRAFREASGM